MKPELLAPAGDRECIRAAVENGADAVYFGLDQGFNARARATNIAREDIPEILGQLHERGVKGYVTLNTLVFTDELPQLEPLIRHLARAGVDAVLVQDLGLVRLIRAICPDLPIHASTQMTLTSAECIQAAEELGIERVVLARELSLAEIRQIRRKTSLELEVFVHGALCVAYSGQCLTSESLGGRSANRGQCAQACRLPYELVCDGTDRDLGSMKYLLSPQDLAAYELTPELMAAGVCSFKIEGRLKTPEYVANITRHYRQVIDQVAAGGTAQLPADAVREMELSFSRGFSPGWLQGCHHKMLVPGQSSAKRGVLLGEVREVRRGKVLVRLACPVRRGDGVAFASGTESEAQGGRVFEVLQNGRTVEGEVSTGEVELIFGHHALDLQRLFRGQPVWKTDDPQLTARLRRTFTQADPQRRVALDLWVEAAAGHPLLVRGQAASGASCEVIADQPLAPARQHPLTPEVLQQQLGRLGGTCYELRHLEARIAGSPMAPFSVLGAVRQEMIRQLQASLRPPERRIVEDSVLNTLRKNDRVTPPRPAKSLAVRVLCRSLEQLAAVLKLDARHVYADFQDIREYAAAVQQAHAAGAEIFLAPPRIQKPNEVGIFRVLRRHGADGWLVRNLAGLRFAAQHEIPFVTDYSLNAANELTVQYLYQQGAQRVTPSYDLNREQLLQLIAATATPGFEVVVHQHMPMFHMEHCVFCAVLSPGTNKTNCGRPCDRHQVQLRDRIGMEHPLTADVGCRNTLFNAVPQSAAEIVPELVRAGVSDFRIELLQETAAELGMILEAYRDLLSGRQSGKHVWRALRAANRVGVTRGTLERRDPLAIL